MAQQNTYRDVEVQHPGSRPQTCSRLGYHVTLLSCIIVDDNIKYRVVGIPVYVS
jgi:hypothetical protein